MKAYIKIAIVFLMTSSLSGQAGQDTAQVRKDTTAMESSAADSLKAPAIRPKAVYQVDTTFEAVNLERYYYGIDGREEAFDYNPWEEFLFPDGDAREEDERVQRDQDRDGRE